MYVKSIQLTNYGPIGQFDLQCPFEDDTPKPVVFVGENGSGKSLVISHIVNGLIAAKNHAYPETPEVDTGKVYKIRNSGYVKTGEQFYFAKIQYQSNLAITEMRTIHPKVAGASPAWVPSQEIERIWEKMPEGKSDYIDDTMLNRQADLLDIFRKNCVLFFPSNRFEEPAWLNEQHLKSKAQYVELTRTTDHTDRKVISHSPLDSNKDWFFSIVYDMLTFGNSAPVFEIAQTLVHTILGRNARLGVGGRRNRIVSVVDRNSDAILVPNIFQLSSGETSLLNLFLSILRDFDMSGAQLSTIEDIRGIVVVDEVDLHLHSIHQSRILPGLIHLFPNVQFILTTHSPLFVLGMNDAFGSNGFSMYRLPSSEHIIAEEFSEFQEAYRVLTTTHTHEDEIRQAIERAQQPVVFPEGDTDKKYIERAAVLLGKDDLLSRVQIHEGGGAGNMKKVWEHNQTIAWAMPQKVILLFDCEQSVEKQDRGNLSKRLIPRQDAHPINKGIENLFSESTLERARAHKPALVDKAGAYEKTTRGAPEVVPERWTIDDAEKTNLCDWLCANGTKEDFDHFQVIFDLIEEVLSPPQSALVDEPS